MAGLPISTGTQRQLSKCGSQSSYDGGMTPQKAFQVPPERSPGISSSCRLQHRSKYLSRKPFRSQVIAQQPYSKSTSGCLSCKSRKKKCDESQPSCKRCLQHKEPCIYKSSIDRRRRGLSQILPTMIATSQEAQVGSDAADASGEAFAAKLELQQNTRTFRMLMPNEQGKHETELFHFFFNITWRTLYDINSGELFRNALIHDMESRPSLRCGLLALTSCHLMQLQPDCLRHRSLYSHYVTRFTELFQQDIESFSGGSVDAEVLMSNTILMNVLSFSEPVSTKSYSWLWQTAATDVNHALGWITVQSRNQPVFRTLGGLVDQGFWVFAILRTQKSEPHLNQPIWNAQLSEPDLMSIPPAFLELCDISPQITSEQNPYQQPLLVLAEILIFDWRDKALSWVLLSFPVRTGLKYCELLRRKDERAVMILAYWLCVVLHLDLWWVNHRAHNELQAILAKLDGSTDARVQRLLSFPRMTVASYSDNIGDGLSHHFAELYNLMKRLLDSTYALVVKSLHSKLINQSTYYSLANTDSWVSQTPHNPTDALSQTTLVKNGIARHQGSSPTPIFQIVAALAKGTEILAHENTLLLAECRTLRAANEALSKRRRAKTNRIRQGGALTIEDTLRCLA